MVIGIDEVGRGPIAGPVCVAAFQVASLSELAKAVRKIKLPLRDSKKLSKYQREAWFVVLKQWKAEGKCDFAISLVHAETIDRIGIAPSIRRALARSLGKLEAKNKHTMKNITILLDGGLKAPKEFAKQKTIIKGDEKEQVIALASIVAKVHRDRLMTRLAKKYPNYGFADHVGYGTRAHYKAWTDKNSP
jgi:ribonuclease HII